MIYKSKNGATIELPKNMSIEHISKVWHLTGEVRLNGSPHAFELYVEEYRDGAEIRISGDGLNYAKFEVGKEEIPLTTQKLMRIFTDHLNAELNELGISFSIETELKDLLVHYRIILNNINEKDDLVTAYYISLYLEKGDSEDESASEMLCIGNAEIKIDLFDSVTFRASDGKHVGPETDE